MTYTLTINELQTTVLTTKYKDFEVIDNNNYTLFRAKIKSTTLTIYKTGKVLLQGNDCTDIYLEICDFLNIENIDIKNETKKDISFSIGKTILGTDEVGTGDYFGGIVVCASVIPNDKILEFTKMGIKDSKEISDDKIMVLGKQLIESVDHSVLLLNNEKYNKIVLESNANLNKIKAILHNKVINSFIKKYPDTKFDSVVIDGFCDEHNYFKYLERTKDLYENINLIQKAENKYISVAASSIIARYYFLKHLNDLSEKSGYQLLKGASQKVDLLARKIINEKGLDYLYSLAKTNFKNTNKASKESM